METKNNTIIIALLTLIIGLIAGYYFGTSRQSPQYQMSGMHGSMEGMMMGLSGKTGDALDKAFLDEMIIHHQGALEMAQTLLAGTKRPELIKLGNDIISAQTKEIEMMKDWNKTWFNQ